MIHLINIGSNSDSHIQHCDAEYYYYYKFDSYSTYAVSAPRSHLLHKFFIIWVHIIGIVFRADVTDVSFFFL